MHRANRNRAAVEDLMRAGVPNAPVEIVDYDPAWPVVYAAQRERYRDDREAYAEAKNEFIRRHDRPAAPSYAAHGRA